MKDKIIIIKLYDNSDYDYPLIKIWNWGFKDFKKTLITYQKEEDYNIDDFIELIKFMGCFVEVNYLDYDKELYF